MSALPPKADIVECDRHVRFVPKADISREITSSISGRGKTVLGGDEAKVADDFIAAAMIRWMVDTIDHRHVGEIKRAHAF